MQTAVDETLRDEARRFSLRFGCESCAHAEAGGGCSLGFPTAPHRGVELDQVAKVEFCKAFELGA